LVGEDVFRLLQDEHFLASWDALYETCPWATVFQSRAFVASWYQVYRQGNEPILVRAAQAGRLTGLLPLSRSYGAHMITGAGDADSEYQTWLAMDVSCGERFIRAALEELTVQFPGDDIIIMYIPPQSPLSWIETDRHWKSRCILEETRRPLLDLKSPELEKLPRKKEFRSKLNRLKRLGEVSFEYVTDEQRFSAVLDELADQHDFRKGAKYNLTEFRNDPLKKEFMQALFAQKVLHVTLLKLDGEIIASVAAAQGKDWFYLVGINTHAPAYANYSTGYVHFIMLAMQLEEEGFAVFDLTPGGDAYKDRLANTHDQVKKLSVLRRSKFLANNIFAKPLREAARRGIMLGGITPREFKQKWGKKRGRLRAAKGAGPGALLEALADQLSGKAALQVYQVEQAGAVPAEEVVVRQNSLSDLLCFVRQGELRSRWDFLEEAEKRLQSGERAFTLVEAGGLLCCGWVAAAAGQPTGLSLPAGAVLLEGLYCHRRGRHRLRAFLEAVARQVDAPLYVVNSKKSLSKALEKTGLRGIPV